MRSYTTAQIAAACGVSARSVREAMRSGFLAARAPRGQTRPLHSTAAEVEEWFGGPTIYPLDMFNAKGRPVEGPAENEAQVA